MPGKLAGSRLAGTRESKGIGIFVLHLLFLKYRNGIRLKFVSPPIPPKKPTVQMSTLWLVQA